MKSVWLIAFLIIINQTGCSQDKQTRILNAYERDIAQALSITLPDTVGSVQILPYPPRRDLYLEPHTLTISFADFLSVNICGLRQIIAQRNNQLGKFMPISRLLHYEHQLLKQTIICHQKLAPDHALQPKLRQIIATKTKNLPRLYWNATFGSNEFRRQFSLATSATNHPYPDTLDRALTYFIQLHKRLGKSTQDLDQKNIEQAYDAIEQHAHGGRLLQSIGQLTTTLERTNTILQKRLRKGPINPGVETNKIRQAFTRYYIKHVQPRISQTHRNGKDWLTQINRLAEQQKTMPDAFKVYYETQLDMASQSGLWQRFQSAIKAHTTIWQTVLDQTGGLPNPQQSFLFIPSDVPG